MLITLFADFHQYLAAMVLASARLAPAFFLLPFFNSNILAGTLRMPIMLVVAIALWPHSYSEMPEFSTLLYGGLIAKELMIGLIVACLIAWPFWVLHAVGSIIDNQRGATISSSFDPVSGVDTSELANFFNLFAAAVFLLGGGDLLLLKVYAESYRLSDPLLYQLPLIDPAFGLLVDMMSKALMLASPVIASLLLTEVILGLLSRFAPQMNAFAISLTVKSAVTFLILILYFQHVMPDAIRALSRHPGSLLIWFQ